MKWYVAALIALTIAGPVKASAPSAALPATLRVGIQMGRDVPCAADAKDMPVGIADYGKLLSTRLGTTVELCGFANGQGIAKAFADGKVDFAPLNAADYPAAHGSVRPILNAWAQQELPRSPIVAIARPTAGLKTAADVARGRVAVLAKGPLTYDLSRAALAAKGGSGILKAETPVVGSFGNGLTALNAGRIDTLLLPIDYWMLGCAAAKDACRPFKIVWQDRPVPASAWCLRTGLPAELRYRLIGIHVALSYDDRKAFAAVAGPRGAGFDATEATALDVTGQN
jgi:ABC-type phosphate/phosphonate transport system substrate-binding protein